MRALSTILLVLALASPAGAQVFGARGRSNDAAYWLSVDGGKSRALSVSDRASDGTWGLETSSPVRIAIDYGRRDRTIGIAVAHATIPMNFAGPSCPACAAQVTALQAMGTYRVSSPLFSSGLTQIVEFGAGITRWSDIAGRDGNQLPAVKPNDDFTYAVAYGVGLPVGERIELSVRYEMAHARHEGRATQGGSAGSGSLPLNTLRAGARLRLGKQ